MFTRQDAIKLSGLTRTQIGYLEDIGIITPIKPHIRSCLYSWGQILELRIIAKIRETLSLQQIRQAKQYLQDIDFNSDLRSSKIVVGNTALYLLQENEDALLTISGKHLGQFALTQIILCNDVIEDLMKNRSNNIVDFEKKLESSGVANVRRLIKSA
jgi:DNA-binding transcriptional MerR regulator